MNKLIKEFIWFFSIVLLTLLLFHITFGLEYLSNREGNLDINIHDTYFVFSADSYLIAQSSFLFSLIYFFRVVFSKFKNNVINSSYLLFNGLFIFIMTFVILFASFVSTTMNGSETVTIIFLIFQFLAIIFQTIVALKTRKIHNS